MKRLNYNIALFSMFFTFVFSSYCQETYVKNIEKAFSSKNITELELTNKYGKIQVKNWEKDSVKILINYTINAKTKEKLDKTIQAIQFNIQQINDFVVAQTVITNDAALKQDIERIANTFSTTSNNYITIDYKVFIPKHLHLKVENKYGDIYLDKRFARTNITLSHGELNATDFVENVKMNLSFSDAKLKTIKTGDFIFEYSTIAIDNLHEGIIDSKSTTLRIENVQRMKVNSKRDTYSIQNCEEINGTSYLSKWNIRNLSDELYVSAKYGHIFIDQISSQFKNISVDSKYTDIHFTFQKECSYDFQLDHRKVDFSYPPNVGNLTTSYTNLEKEIKLTKGRIGKVNSPSKVKIGAESSEVFISHF